MNIEFTQIEYGSDAWKTAVKLRENSLRKPLGQSFSQEELDEEKDHLHIVGMLLTKIIAAAALVPEGTAMKMQRVAVKESLRNMNIGSKLMNHCEIYAHRSGFRTIYCHARDSAVNFYLKNHYVSEGDYFEEDGIPHLKMKKNLSK